MNRPGVLLAVIAASLAALACDPKAPNPPNPPKPIAHATSPLQHAAAVTMRSD